MKIFSRIDIHFPGGSWTSGLRRSSGNFGGPNPSLGWSRGECFSDSHSAGLMASLRSDSNDDVMKLMLSSDRGRRAFREALMETVRMSYFGLDDIGIDPNSILGILGETDS